MHQTVDVPLSWVRSDVERRLGFRGGRFTRVSGLLSFSVACVLALAFYGALLAVPDTALADMFTQRGWVQYCTVLFSAWSFVILFFKWRKLRLQRQALEYQVVPADVDFVLSSATVDEVMARVFATVDDPKQFVLFNRITVALSNLRNLGRVTDVDDILRGQAEQDESGMETSYSLVQGFVWAIPVLGFIGTVVGLSNAIGSFSGVLSTSERSRGPDERAAGRHFGVEHRLRDHARGAGSCSGNPALPHILEKGRRGIPRPVQ